jgi:Ca-activated chloride channel family protein
MLTSASFSQKATQLIEKGNVSYKQKQFAKAKEEYNKALQKDQSNSVAQFNSGNASQRMNKFEEAAKSFEAAAANAKDPLTKAQALYNQSVALIKQNKLTEAIQALKSSLRLNPNDNDTRENLQRALKELQKQQQPQQNDKQKNKNNKKPKDQPQKPKSNLNEEEADRRLKELAKEEKNLQKDLQKKNSSARQLKDW